MLIEIQGKVQSYDWGKLGLSSKVAELASVSSTFTADANKPYAELWMGTHPSGPSMTVQRDGKLAIPLKDIITEETLGKNIDLKYEHDIPFLFKVLSIGKALSIQAHPDKKLAQRLFKEFPDIYKDPNHKPEMVSFFSCIRHVLSCCQVC